MPKLSPYLTALLLAWLLALLCYFSSQTASDWASLLPATETLTVWLWRLAAALTLAVLTVPLSQYFFRLPRSVQVCGAFALSLLLLEGLMKLLPVLQGHWHLDKKFWETGAFWTSAMLLVSAPVAFVVWRFRDENQSKDINLKEFQKISEWVTGAHFQDAKQGETLSGSLPENTDTALHSFSKQDGAVGLQIAAVYNLLPFYRGDYGQAFEKPSVHLLHSAWKVLQHDILQELDNADDNETRKDLIKQLHQRADSPLGQAITRVLLACDYAKKPLLHRHLEILPGVCLSGMDFRLAGVETEILYKTLFCKQELNGAQWQGMRGSQVWFLSQTAINLSEAVLYDANLSDIWLLGANLSNAVLSRTNLSNAWLLGTDLSGAQLNNANLSGTQLFSTNLFGAWLDNANLFGARLNGVSLLNTGGLTAKQLLTATNVYGCLINSNSFSPQEQQQLQAKGLILLHYGSDTVPQYLFCKYQKNENWSASHAADSIPFPIDLAATQAANPDWEISIE